MEVPAGETRGGCGGSCFSYSAKVFNGIWLGGFGWLKQRYWCLEASLEVAR